VVSINTAARAMTDKAHAPYPYMGINGDYFDQSFLEGVERELTRKLPIWSAGIVEPTECEKFAYHVLNLIKTNSDFKV
jgi:hypothetical protein